MTFGSNKLNKNQNKVLAGEGYMKERLLDIRNSTSNPFVRKLRSELFRLFRIQDRNDESKFRRMWAITDALERMGAEPEDTWKKEFLQRWRAEITVNDLRDLSKGSDILTQIMSKTPYRNTKKKQSNPITPAGS